MLPKLTPYSQPSSGLTFGIEASIFQLAPSIHLQPGDMYASEAASREGQLTDPSSVEKAPRSALDGSEGKRSGGEGRVRSGRAGYSTYIMRPWALKPETGVYRSFCQTLMLRMGRGIAPTAASRGEGRAAGRTIKVCGQR